MADNHGKYVWYELMTTDAAAAERFYAAVVGWTPKDSGMPDIRYTLMHVGEAPIAGIMGMPDEMSGAGAPSFWGGYIGVDDVDATAKKAEELGGKVCKEPTDIPGVGRFAVLSDPQGATFMIMRGNLDMPAPPAREVPAGFAAWRELMTTDAQAALDFYAALFGWKKGTAHDMGEHGVYQLFETSGGEETGGMMNKPAFIPGPPYWGYYFMVDSVTAAADRIREGGGQIANGPMEVPGGQWVIQGVDPQGAHFNVVSNAK